MAEKRSLNQIFDWFKKGAYPTAAQFWDTFFSFWHKDDILPMSSIEDLSENLNKKYNQVDGEELEKRMDNAEGRLDGHDGDIQRIDEDLEDHETRLDGHDADIGRIDEKNVEQDGRLDGHDMDINRIDAKDVEQDDRLSGHDTDIKRIDEKDAEQDDRLDTHDKEIDRIDLKDIQQDNRLDGHDTEIKRMDEKNAEQDGRLDEVTFGRINDFGISGAGNAITDAEYNRESGAFSLVKGSTFLLSTENAVSASKLKDSRTMGISGAVTGVATSFDGTANITISTTEVDATKLTGKVASARLEGAYDIDISGKAAAVINSSDQSTGIKFWIGSLNEYEAIAKKDTDTIYHII